MTLTLAKRFLIVVREAPKSVNHGGGGARSHPYAAHREKTQWEGLFLAEMMVARVPRAMTFCSVDIAVMWRTKRRRDLENYRHPIVKPLADALVKGGYVQDDTEEWFAVSDFRFASQEGPWPWPTEAIVQVTMEAHYQ